MSQPMTVTEHPAVERYFSAIRNLVCQIEGSQNEAIRQAARMVADTVQRKGAVFVYDTGHMLSRELVGRAGGLVLLLPLRAEFRVDGSVPFRRPGAAARVAPVTPEIGLAQARAIMAEADVRAGDLVFVGSVSGRQVLPVELSLIAKQRGALVVAVTSRAYSTSVRSNHPSGKRLMEVADLVLDHGAPPGDAMLQIPGIDAPMAPASGIGAAVVMWAVVLASAEELARRGISPSVYRSINLDDSDSHNREALRLFEERGY
ncbi:MAG: sugar isomerase domain-containing protein [Bacillota bacterium]